MSETSANDGKPPVASRIGRVKTLARNLFATRLDKSAGRVRVIAIAMLAAYGGIAIKLVALGLSHDPPMTLKEEIGRAHV